MATFLDKRLTVNGRNSNVSLDNHLNLDKYVQDIVNTLIPNGGIDTDWVEGVNGVYNNTDDISIGTDSVTAFTVLTVDGGVKVDWSGGLQQTSLKVNNDGLIGSATQLDLSSFINLQNNTATVANKALTTHDSELYLDSNIARLKHNDVVTGSNANIQAENNRIYSFLDSSSGGGDAYFELYPGGMYTEVNQTLPASNGQFNVNAGTAYIYGNDGLGLSDFTANFSSGFLGAVISFVAQTSPASGSITINSTASSAPHATINFDTKDGAAGVQEYADNATATAAGLTLGDIYRTGDLLKIVH